MYCSADFVIYRQTKANWAKLGSCFEIIVMYWCSHLTLLLEVNLFPKYEACPWSDRAWLYKHSIRVSFKETP